MQKSIEKILVDIIKHELNLPDNYGKTSNGDVIPSVIIYGQNIKLFNTDKMQITICGDRNIRVWSNRISYRENTDGSISQIQDMNTSQKVQIDLRSRNNEARDLKMKVYGAVTNSPTLQNAMDLYNFKVSSLSNIYNTTGVDGGSSLNRYTIDLTVLAHEQIITPVDYYDKFQTTFNNEQGQFAQYQYGAND